MSLKYQNRKLRQSIALQIFKECRKKKWTDTDLAQQMYIAPNVIKRILFGQADMPLNVYVRIADILGKSLKVSFKNEPENVQS